MQLITRIFLLGSLIIPLSLLAATSSSNFQLGYNDIDSGGGIGSSSNFKMHYSAIGKAYGEANGSGGSSSNNFTNIPGTQTIDDDGDGLDTGVEVSVFNTDPNNIDTDNDNVIDLDEVINGSDPLDSNSPNGGQVPLPLWSLILLIYTLITIVFYNNKLKRIPLN